MASPSASQLAQCVSSFSRNRLFFRWSMVVPPLVGDEASSPDVTSASSLRRRGVFFSDEDAFLFLGRCELAPLLNCGLSSLFFGCRLEGEFSPGGIVSFFPDQTPQYGALARPRKSFLKVRGLLKTNGSVCGLFLFFACGSFLLVPPLLSERHA